MPPIAIIYARVSDRKQVEPDVSVPAQIDLGTKRAAELGATVLRVFTDAGRSAFKEANRRTFEAAVEFAITVGAKYFIVWSSARFARNKFEAVYYKRELDKAGIDLVYLSSNIDRKTDDGWLVDSMFEIVDEMTSRQISKDTRRSMIRVAQQGNWAGGRPPFGYCVEADPEDAKRRRMVPKPDEAYAARQIFERRASGLGAKSIALELNRRGVLNRGRLWSKQTLLNLLKSELYIGMRIFNRRDRKHAMKPRDEWIIVESHEAIVDRALFERVQQLIGDAADTTNGSSKSTHPFTGLLRCGLCGKTLQTETANGNGGHYAYYNCRSYLQGVRCPGQRLRADDVDEVLEAAILERVLSPANLREIADEIVKARGAWSSQVSDRRRAILTTIADLQRRNSSLYELLELHGKDAPNLGDLTVRLRANNEAMKGAEAELVALDATRGEEALDAPQIDAIGEFMRNALTGATNAARAREFYRGFIENIAVQDGEAEIRYDPARLLSQGEPVRSTVRWRPALASLRTTRTLRVSLRPRARRGRPARASQR